MAAVKPKKHLGQHFLTDQNIAQKIVESLELEDTKNIIEIGPGMGVLTNYLMEMEAINFKVIEVDKESVDYLQTNLNLTSDQVIYGDFLKENLFSDMDKVALIGNFPYNISSQIFFKVLENREKVSQVVGMIQKEVAERICAKHGNKTYGILSVLLQAFYSIEYLFTVNEHVFNPPPKVKSAVVRLKRNEVTKLNCDEKLFFRVVKTCFNQRRKTIRNSIKPIMPVAAFESNYLSLRPEQMSVSDFVEFTNLVEKTIS